MAIASSSENLDDAAPLSRIMGPGMIDQNPPHQLGRDAKKMAAIFPVGTFLTNQLQIRLMHQRGRLQGVIGPLVTHVAGGQAAQLSVDDGNQLVEDALVTLAELLQQQSYV
jgi:hypothetical protein